MLYIEILDKELKNDIVDDMVWSFSRINGFTICRRAWYLTYIMKVEQKPSFFSEYGTFVHSILEKYDRGELELFELSDYFSKQYENNVVSDAPPNKYVDLKKSYFNQGVKFFESFNGHLDETIEPEKEVNFILNLYGKDRKITGFIDRLSINDGNLAINDYKSKKQFQDSDELDKYLKQLYIYSIPVFDEYGKYPKKLRFVMFRSNKVVEVDFDEKQVDVVKKWASDVIKDIYEEEKFPRDMDTKSFWCQHICGCYNQCVKCKE